MILVYAIAVVFTNVVRLRVLRFPACWLFLCAPPRLQEGYRYRGSVGCSDTAGWADFAERYPVSFPPPPLFIPRSTFNITRVQFRFTGPL